MGLTSKTKQIKNINNKGVHGNSLMKFYLFILVPLFTISFFIYKSSVTETCQLNGPWVGEYQEREKLNKSKEAIRRFWKENGNIVDYLNNISVNPNLLTTSIVEEYGIYLLSISVAIKNFDAATLLLDRGVSPVKSDYISFSAFMNVAIQEDLDFVLFFRESLPFKYKKELDTLEAYILCRKNKVNRA